METTAEKSAQAEEEWTVRVKYPNNGLYSQNHWVVPAASRNQAKAQIETLHRIPAQFLTATKGRPRLTWEQRLWQR